MFNPIRRWAHWGLSLFYLRGKESPPRYESEPDHRGASELSYSQVASSCTGNKINKYFMIHLGQDQGNLISFFLSLDVS